MLSQSNAIPGTYVNAIGTVGMSFSANDTPESTIVYELPAHNSRQEIITSAYTRAFF